MPRDQGAKYLSPFAEMKSVGWQSSRRVILEFETPRKKSPGSCHVAATLLTSSSSPVARARAPPRRRCPIKSNSSLLDPFRTTRFNSPAVNNAAAGRGRAAVQRPYRSESETLT